MEGFLQDKQWLRAPWTCNNITLNIKKSGIKSSSEILLIEQELPITVKEDNKRNFDWLTFWRSGAQFNIENVTAIIVYCFAILKTHFKSLCRQYFMRGFSGFLRRSKDMQLGMDELATLTWP